MRKHVVHDKSDERKCQYCGEPDDTGICPDCESRVGLDAYERRTHREREDKANWDFVSDE